MSCSICGSRCKGAMCSKCRNMQRLDDELEWRMDDLDDELDQEEEAPEDVDRGDGPIADGGSLVDACPECDSASIRARSPSMRGATGRSERNYCADCGASFDEPVVRPAKHPGVLRGLARQLDEADPDDVGRRLVTDGGRDSEPLAVIKNATVYYYEDTDDPVRYEGRVEIFWHYVRLCEPTSTWIPRDRVQQVMEL